MSPSIAVVCPSNFEYTQTTTQTALVSENNNFGIVCNGFDLGALDAIPTGLWEIGTYWHLATRPAAN